MLAGWSMLILGAYRINLIELHKANVLVNWWHCIRRPPFILFTFSLTAQAGMLLTISVDRFIAITLPLKYVIFTRRYAIFMVASCYFLAASYTIVFIVYTNTVNDLTEPIVHAICIVRVGNGLYSSVFYVRMCLSSLSVPVYAVVWCLFRRYQNITVTTFPTIETHLHRAQRHLTITVGICALFTLVFYVIPTILMFILDAGIWAPLYCVVNCVNAVVNVFVYSLRQDDIRQGLKLLFLCKELPPQAAQQLHREMSICVIAKEAMIVMEHMGVVVSNPLFREQQSASNES
jgi:hypothetical protein